MASTDEDVYWKSQTVPTIKQYLKDRGVSAGKRKKAELIALAVKAQKLQLETTENDSVADFQMQISDGQYYNTILNLTIADLLEHIKYTVIHEVMFLDQMPFGVGSLSI